MSIDISSVAYGLKQDTSQSAYPMKLGWAQQCVAAAMGYQSLAALQASGDLDPEFSFDHLVIDWTVPSFPPGFTLSFVHSQMAGHGGDIW